MPFKDRTDAGRRLARPLAPLRGPDVVVVGLPRGGVPVAAEVARALSAPLDVILVRKLGVPGQPELAMGAIGEGGVRVLNDVVLAGARVSDDELAAVERAESERLAAAAARLRDGRSGTDLTDRTVIVVDDGVATGATAQAACQVVWAAGARRVILAVPVAAPDSLPALRRGDTEVVCLEAPRGFAAVGQWYDDFGAVSDGEVASLLDENARMLHQVVSGDAGSGERRRPPVDREVVVEAGPVRLPGHLTVPPDATGVVVFAHGSGSSRHSPRNRYVADVLASAGLGTLLFDLLTSEEEGDRRNVFDIGLLADRLTGATGWLRGRVDASVRVGLFGASTGAGAALWAAAEPGSDIAAVVSRGGRPDLAGDRLPSVAAPTLLIVGGDDVEVLELNRAALARLDCPADLAVVPGATHLFEEPGTLTRAAELARDWFTRYLSPTDADG